MAEENENIIEEVSSETPEQVEQPKVEQPRNEKGQFKSKFDSSGDDSVIKIDLDKPPSLSEEVEQEEPLKEEVDIVDEKPETLEEVVEETIEEQVQEQPVIEEVVVDKAEEIKEEIQEAVTQSKQTGQPLPEQLQRVVQFMNETGGDLNDYVKLNRDVSKLDDSEVLDEYYKVSKPHLTSEERSFLLEDSFGVDEDMDDERTIRKKKIALKEQVAEARAHLDRQKSKYYQDIKAGSKLTQQQQKAIDFFNRYSKETEIRSKRSQEAQKKFAERTNNVFNEKFKGFEYNIGDKKFRINVKDPSKVKDTQSNISNFVNKFANKDKSEIVDMKGYHKSLFTAMNADAIANHFYEQGRADAIKARVAKDKNINLEPRKTHSEIKAGGVKYRVMSPGESSSDIKNRSFKIRKKS
tara:strand:- start:2570 stop:3796 length:1227 start_codon:yes stop_codon:yes gene_type:complete